MNEQYGPFSPHGGQVWSANQTPEQSSGLSYAAAAGVGAGAAWWQLTRTLPDNTRHLDTVAVAMQQLAHESPFQLLSTFRAPEWLSPWTSVVHQGLTPENGSYAFKWAPEQFHNQGTYEYLRKASGASESQMQAFGFTRSSSTFAAVHESNRANELVFRRSAKSGLGDLWVRTGNTEQLFMRGARLMQLTPDSYDASSLVDAVRPVNRAFYSVLQSMDMWQPGFYDPATGRDRISDLFSSIDKEGNKVLSGMAPIIGEGPVGSLGDLRSRSTLLRAPLAFGMERFNRLMTGMGEQVFGQSFNTALEATVGTHTVPGPASSMFWRFGVGAAKVGGLYYGLQETDWIRRQAGVIGNIGVSAGVAAGVGMFASRMKYSSRASAAIGISAFAAQTILPGFEKGVWPGLVETYANANVLAASPVNPFNYYRRTLEGFAPSSTSWETGALLGVGALAASYIQSPVSGRTLIQQATDWVGPDKFGLPQTDELLNTRQSFWRNINTYMQGNGGYSKTDGFNAWERMNLRAKMVSRHINATGGIVSGFKSATTQARDMWRASEQGTSDLRVKGSYARQMNAELDSIASRYSGKVGFGNNVARQAEGFASQVKYALLGLNIHEADLVSGIRAKGFASPLGRAGAIFASVFGAHQLVTGGAFGSMEDSSELQDIYSGRKLVEIKKGRFWEGGGRAFEGGDTSYHRPHYVALTLNTVREHGIWGEEEDSRSPLYKMFLKNFTYELEKEQYWDRPYPISGGAFQDIPIIGSTLAQTVGRLFKTPKLMHTQEWLRESPEGIEAANVYEGWKKEPSYQLGSFTEGKPIAGLDARHAMPSMLDQFHQLEGLCLHGDTLISTDCGKKPIRDIEIGEKVLSLDGLYHQVVGKLEVKEHQKQMMKIVTKAWKHDLLVTENHWVPALIRQKDKYGSGIPFDDFTLVDTQVKNLKPGDYLVAPQIKKQEHDILIDLADFTEGQVVSHQWIYHPKILPDRVEVLEKLEADLGLSIKTLRKEYNPHAVDWAVKHIKTSCTDLARTPRYILIDEDFMNFCGWYVAEGHTDGFRIQFTLSHLETDVASHLEAVGAGVGCTINKRSGRATSATVVRLRNGPLARWLDFQFGVGALNKCIPAWVKSSKFLASFMSGLLNGDGFYTPIEKRGGFKSSSAKLVVDVAESLLALGVRSSYRLDVLDSGKGFYPQGTPRGVTVYSSLRIPPTHVSRYGQIYLNGIEPEPIEEIPGRGGTTFIRDGLFYIPIHEVTSIEGHPEVYDLTIENLHYYVANQIAVHNTGFFKNVISKQVLGYDIPYSDAPVLADSGRMTSDLRRFWENQAGGMFFLNEGLRRVFPSPPGDREYFNPIMNTMPEWIPENLHYGDPYAGKFMEWGEARLPGAGYEALHPELRGTPQDDYPLIYQYDILSSVAPFSKELRAVQRKLHSQRFKGYTDEQVDAWMDEIDARVQDRYAVQDYQFIDKNALQLPSSYATQGFMSGLKEFVRGSSSPGEYLIPMGFRPVQKLWGDDRSPIERYEYERMYGTPLAFWTEPWRDWFRPALNSTANRLGFTGKPSWRQEADSINQQYDELEFLQYMRAAEQAKAAGNSGRAFNYQFMASTTIAGANPYGDVVSTYWSLPKEDRGYFQAFAEAPREDRARILEMIPENQVRLYQGIWERMDSNDPTLRPGVGRPKSAYLQSRQQEIQTQYAGRLPDANWIGWHPDVDMQDIKVRHINELGKDLSDFGVWQNELTKAMQQPYLEGSAVEYTEHSREGIRAQMIAKAAGNFTVHSGRWQNSYTDIQYNDDRMGEIRSGIERSVNGY